MRQFRQILLILMAPPALMAQNLDLYGLSGNPITLGQNPAAQTDLSFHFALPGITQQGNLTTPLKNIWGDFGLQLQTLEAPNVGLSYSADVDILSIGFKHKFGYSWVHTGANLDASFHLDKDLILFGLYGMKDANGVIDPNYYGDYSHSDFGFSALEYATLGHQYDINDKIRVGGALQVNRLLGGFKWSVDQWELESIFNNSTQTNSLKWRSNMEISAFGLIADGAQLDSAIDFPRYLVMGMVPSYLKLLKEQNDSYSLNAGVTYTPSKKLTLLMSITGIPISTGSNQGGVVNSRSLQWQSQFDYDGFKTGFSLQDTSTWGDFLTNLQAQAIDDFSIKGAPPVNFYAPFSIQTAGYYEIFRNHKVGMHFAHVNRLAGQHQSFAIEYQGFFGSGLQIAAAYRLHAWNGVNGASELSSILQHRILPWTSIYLGTNLWLSIPGRIDGSIQLPGNFQSWQLTAGLNVTLFEKSFYVERRERRAAKKAEKALSHQVGMKNSTIQ